MKFLFDGNISYRILKKLKKICTDCLHVNQTGLTQPASDLDLWNYARINHYTIVSFDKD